MGCLPLPVTACANNRGPSARHQEAKNVDQQCNMSGMPSADGALLTDLYELTMLQAYFERGMNELAVFELFIRTLPPQRNFLVAAGAGTGHRVPDDAASARRRLRLVATKRKIHAGIHRVAFGPAFYR
ncbi:hypothetical protein OKW43_007962 [Paraburkholderia sp. WC7.3g]|uniref:hypothetical protein n=1 Tax=Paraburkholderia sp. WC7.3g TaxID=2991070 RepID=UPI003D24CF84